MHSLIVRFNFFQIYIILVEYNTGIPVICQIYYTHKEFQMFHGFIYGRHTSSGKEYTWTITEEQYGVLDRVYDYTWDGEYTILVSVVSCSPSDCVPQVTWVEVTGFGRKMSKIQDHLPMVGDPEVIRKEVIKEYMPGYFGDDDEESSE